MFESVGFPLHLRHVNVSEKEKLKLYGKFV